MDQMPCSNTAELSRYEGQQAALDVTEDDVIAAKDDLLCADLGEFCDLVLNETTRENIDTILQSIACTTDEGCVVAYARRIKSLLDARVYAVAQKRACDAEALADYLTTGRMV